MKNVLYIFFTIFAMTTLLISSDINIKLVNRFSLSQEKAYLTADYFAVTEDELFIIPHAKEGHLKLFKKTGDLYKIVGRKGPGPKEFLLPGPCDYKKPFFAILDTRKMKVLLYRRTENNDFILINDLFCLGVPNNIKLYGNNIIVGYYISSKKGEKYSLYMQDFRSEAGLRTKK